jgi:hypothetical protein
MVPSTPTSTPLVLEVPTSMPMTAALEVTGTTCQKSISPVNARSRRAPAARRHAG